MPTGVVRALYPRLNKITILVDIDKCLAIVEDQSGDLRQCQKKPTQTGDDSLCSSNHSLSWGKVTEGIEDARPVPQYEKDKGRPGVAPSGAGALPNHPSHKTQAPPPPQRERPDVDMGNTSPIEPRRPSAQGDQGRRSPADGMPMPTPTPHDINHLQEDLRRELQEVRRETGSDIRDGFKGLTDGVRRPDLTDQPLDPVKQKKIRAFEEAIAAKQLKILELTKSAAKSREAGNIIHNNALGCYEEIDRLRREFDQKMKQEEIKIRNHFRTAEERAVEANRDYNEADKLLGEVSGLMRSVETERSKRSVGKEL